MPSRRETGIAQLEDEAARRTAAGRVQAAVAVLAGVRWYRRRRNHNDEI